MNIHLISLLLQYGQEDRDFKKRFENRKQGRFLSFEYEENSQGSTSGSRDYLFVF